LFVKAVERKKRAARVRVKYSCFNVVFAIVSVVIAMRLSTENLEKRRLSKNLFDMRI